MNKCWTFELAKRWREFQSRRAAGQDQLEMGSRKKGKSTMQRLDAVVYRGKGVAAMVKNEWIVRGPCRGQEGGALAPTRCWIKERDTGGGRREEGTETRKAKGGRLHGRHSGAVEAVEMARSGIAQRRTSQFPGNTTRLRRNLFPAPVSFPPKPKARAHHWLAECGFLSASFQIWEGRSRSAGFSGTGSRKQEAAMPFLFFNFFWGSCQCGLLQSP